MRPKNYKSSETHYTNAIQDSHNEDSHALDIVTVNNLVPARYGRVELSYFDSGPGSGSVSEARYYSDGTYQETKITTIGDALGSAHKTTVNFNNKTPESLSGKSFIIYDDIGAVSVWFNLDFNDTEPTVEIAYRSIEVNILSTHNYETIANRTAQAINRDVNFLAVHSMYYTLISSITAGPKLNSVSVDAGLMLKNTTGVAPVSLNNRYFFINSALNVDNYYVWYNVDGQGIDPLLSEKTGIMVPIPAGASAEVVAQNTSISLNATNKFLTNIDSGDLLVTNVNIGTTNIPKDFNTNFALFTKKLGKDRELIVTLRMEYDDKGNIISVERL